MEEKVEEVVDQEKTIESLKNPNKKNKKKLISNLIFLILASALVVVIALNIGEVSDIAKSFSKIGTNYQYLLIALGLTIVYFLLWPSSQCIYAKALKAESTIGESYLIACSEHFYNGITPFAAGGQPFQIYSYTKCGVKTAKATGIILATFVTFMMVTNLFALSSLFFIPKFIEGLKVIDAMPMLYVGIVGVSINFLVLLFMFALGTSKKLRHFLVKLMTKLAYWKFWHKPNHKIRNRIGAFMVNKIPAFEEYCRNAQIAFKEVWSHKLATFFALLVKIIDMAIYYTVPFFLLKSLGISVGYHQMIIVLFATSFAINAVVWLPTPGATGGIEFAFAFAVAAAINIKLGGDSTTVSLLWRMLTFYFIIIISFISTFILEAKIGRKYKKELAKNV